MADEVDAEAEAIWARLERASLDDDAWESEFTPNPHHASKHRAQLVKLGARAVPTLLRRIDHPCRTTRVEIYCAFADLGPAASKARPALESRLSRVDAGDREVVAKALASVSGQAHRSAHARGPRPTLPPEADLATARAFVHDRLEDLRRDAREQAESPYWRGTGGNVKQWVARAYGVALAVLAEQEPAHGETKDHYFTRVADAVRAKKSSEPDADDEGWFSSALDEAALVVAGVGARALDT